MSMNTMINKLIAPVVLMCGIIASPTIIAQEHHINRTDISFVDKTTWAGCENGFEDPKKKNGKLTKNIKEQVFFDESKNWMRTFQTCAYAKFKGQDYLIRKFFLVHGNNALYIIFKENNAYGVYGDYGRNGERFFRKAKVGVDTEILKEILDEYLVQQQWMDIE